MTTSRERSDWYEVFGRVLLFVVVQAPSNGIRCIVDCATFEFNSFQIVESVELRISIFDDVKRVWLQFARPIDIQFFRGVDS